MKSLRWRYSAVLGMLVFVGFLFCFSSTQGYAYPAPKFQDVMLFSFHEEGVLGGTTSFARISGPSPLDVESFDVSGNGAAIPITPSKSFLQFGLFYSVSNPGVFPDGAYTFTVKDKQGRSTTKVINYSYNGTVPQVDPTTMQPVNGAYVGTTTPTLRFSPVAGNYLYNIVVYDMNGIAVWYWVAPNAATSYTIPDGILQPNTAYFWQARTWDTAEQNMHQTGRLYFYTGTKAAPELNDRYVLSFPSGLDDIGLFPYGGRGLNVAPWDISYFRCTGPDLAVYNLTTRRVQFNFPLYYSGWKIFDPPTTIPPDGTYTFEIEDDLGQKASATSTYTYNPIPDFIADTRLPVNNAYIDTLPTFSWSRVQGDPGDGSYRYSIRIMDYSGDMRWIDSPWSSDTTFTPTPSELSGLPVGTSYKWRVNVLNGNNYRNSDNRIITINEPSPVLDIKANGSDGSLTVSSSDQVSIDISLYPGDKAGQNADWWVGVLTSFDPPLDWFTYVYPTGWQSGINLCVQAPLVNLPSFEVFNMALPVGTYTFFFALDDPDGMPVGPWLGLDSVEVTVE